MPNPQDQVTKLLRQVERGQREVLQELFPLVYDELKAVARRHLAAEPDGHTLDTTALVHESYFRLVRQEEVEWQSRAHFFAIAARAMRRILIDHARRRTAKRRGGTRSRVALDDLPNLAAPARPGADRLMDLIALDDALNRLADTNARGADVVVYRFFGGLTHRETAEVMGVSEITVRRTWNAARAWLRRELVRGEDRPGPAV